MDKLLTLDEAGAILGVTGERVSQLVKQGRIPAERFGPPNKPYVRLRESDVRRLDAQRRIPKALPNRKPKSTPAEPIAA